MARRRASELPRVGVRDAAPPGSPSCPACGDPLFPWLDGGEGIPPVRRCETCGLWRSDGEGEAGAIGEITEKALRLDPAEEIAIRIDDAGSLQAMFGAGRWSSLDRSPGSVSPSRDAASRLMKAAGLTPGRARPRFRRSVATTWQTLINLLTFERNFAPRALAGELRPSGAADGSRYAVDAAISVLVAVPAAIVALAVEVIATAFGRGGAVELRARRAPDAGSGR